jgi:hypothetical protein
MGSLHVDFKVITHNTDTARTTLVSSEADIYNETFVIEGNYVSVSSVTISYQTGKKNHQQTEEILSVKLY